MRAFVIAVLVGLFALAFVALLASDSLLRQIGDAAAVARSARAAGTRAKLVEAAVEHIGGELQARPGLEGLSRPQLRAAIERVVTEEWMQENLVAVHRALLAAVAAADEPAVLDLRAVKAGLAEAVADLERRARSECRSLFDAAACDDPRAVAALSAVLGERARGALARIPERVDLLGGAGRRDRDRAARGLGMARDLVGVGRALRWAGLALIAVLLGAVLLAGRGAPGRALRALGAALLVGAGLYLLLLAGLAGPGRRALDGALTRAHAAEVEGESRLESLAAGAAQQLVVQIAVDAFARPLPLVGGAAAGGLVLLGVGFARRRR